MLELAEDNIKFSPREKNINENQKYLRIVAAEHSRQVSFLLTENPVWVRWHG